MPTSCVRARGPSRPRRPAPTGVAYFLRQCSAKEVAGGSVSLRPGSANGGRYHRAGWTATPHLPFSSGGGGAEVLGGSGAACPYTANKTRFTRWVRHRFDIGSPAELCHTLRPGCARPGLLPQPPQCSLTPQSLRFRAKLGLHIIHFEGKFPSPRTWIPDGTGSGYRRALLDELWW